MSTKWDTETLHTQCVPLTKALREEYQSDLQELNKRICVLQAQRKSGDISDSTRRKLHALECRRQAIEDRLDQNKRKRHQPSNYTISK